MILKSIIQVSKETFEFSYHRVLKGPFVLVICLVFCFLPILIPTYELDPVVDKKTKLYSALDSKYYQYTLVASLSVTFPMLVDYIIDKLVPNQERIAKGLVPRRDLILALSVPNVVIFVVVIFYGEYRYLPCIHYARQLFYFYSFLSYMIEFCHPIWTTRSTFFMSMCMGTSCIVSAFSSFVKDDIYILYLRISVVFCILGVVQLIILSIWWFLHVRRMDHKIPKKHIYQYNIFLVAFLFLVVGYGTLYANNGNHAKIQHLGTSFWTAYTLITILFTTVVTVLNGRIVRMEAADSGHALQVKKTFVRYISHEIRTPLNTVFLGLKLLEKEISDHGGNESIVMTVRDIKESCNISLEILNDLLTFDKLESGLLRLEQKKLYPWPFLRDTIRPFYVQAREAGVTILFDSQMELPSRFRKSHVMADSFKLAQVVRNLVSNALKFTPRGGTVTIKLLKVTVAIEHGSMHGRRSRGENGYLDIATTPQGPTSQLPDSVLTENHHHANNNATQQQLPRHETNIKPFVESPGNRAGQDVNSNLQALINLPANLTAATRLNSISISPTIHLHALSNQPHPAGPPHHPSVELLRLQVIDTGCGISQENQAKVFHEIIQFEPGRLQAGGGSGLGLYISKGIVEMHNGNISVWSAGEGHGCTFTLDLPLLEAETDDPNDYNDDEEVDIFSEQDLEETSPSGAVPLIPTNIKNVHDVTIWSHQGSRASSGSEFQVKQFTSREVDGNTAPPATNTATTGMRDVVPSSASNPFMVSSPGTPSGTKSVTTPLKSVKLETPPRGGKKLNVLVADDSKMNRKMIIRLIESKCEQCIEAETGLQAIERYKQTLSPEGPFIDLILMDHHMPELDGPDAVKAIRSLGFRGLVIGITGNALKEDMEILLRAGADLVMAKPLDMDQFNRVITERMRLKSQISFRALSLLTKKRKATDILMSRPLLHNKGSKVRIAVDSGGLLSPKQENSTNTRE